MLAAISALFYLIPGDRLVRRRGGGVSAVYMPFGLANHFRNDWRKGEPPVATTAPGRILARSILWGVVGFGILWGPVAWSDHVSISSIQISMYLNAKTQAGENVDLEDNEDYAKLTEYKTSDQYQVHWIIRTIPPLALTAAVASLSSRELELSARRQKTRVRGYFLPLPPASG